MYLLDKLTFLGFMDEKHVIKIMEESFGYSAVKTIELLNYLENKGYLCTYEYEGRNILCFTELMWSCVHNESLRNLIQRRFPQLKYVGSAILYGAQDMPRVKLAEHLKKVDRYTFFNDKLNMKDAFTDRMPAS